METRREKVLTPGDPRRKLLLGLGLTALAWAIFVFANPLRGTMDLGPLVGLIGYAVGFFFSAYVGMHIYFFTTARTQEREWRQRYRVEHVEDIFGPLYDDIVKVIDSLEDWSYASLEKWPGIKKSHYVFFVDEAVKAKLDGLEGFLAGEFSQRLRKAQDAASTAAVEAFRKATENRLAPDRDSTMSSYLGQRYLLDPTSRSLRGDLKKHLRDLVGNLDGTLISYEVLDNWLSLGKEAAEGRTEVTDFRPTRTKALEDAKSLRNLLAERVQRPYAISEP